MKTKNIKQLREEQKSIEILAKNIINADFSFRIYYSIFRLMKNRKRLEIYNEYIFAFHSVINSSLESFISNISRITDPKEQGGNKNLSIEYIKDIVDTSNADNNLSTQVENELNKLRKVRNKIISHLDRDASKNIREVLSTLEFQEIRIILDNLLKEINHYSEIHFKEFQRLTHSVDSEFQPYYFDNRLDKDLSNLYCLFQNDNKRKEKLNRFFNTYESRKADKELNDFIENLSST